jgi:hypothetical protein
MAAPAKARALLLALVLVLAATALAASAIAEEETLPAHTTEAVSANLARARVFLPRGLLTVEQVIDLVKESAKVEVVYDPEVKRSKSVSIGPGTFTAYEVLSRLERARGIRTFPLGRVLYVIGASSPRWGPQIQIRAGDESTRLEVSFDETPVAEAVATIASLSGVHFEAAALDSRTVTLHLSRRPFSDVMAVFCYVTRLDLVKKGKRNVIRPAWSREGLWYLDRWARRETTWVIEVFRVTVAFKAKPAVEVLEFLRREMADRWSEGRNIRFVFHPAIDAARPIEVRSSRARVVDVLQEVVHQLGARYELRGNEIVIVPAAGT